MLIFHPKYRAYYQQASAVHRKKILWSVLWVNVLLLVIIGGLIVFLLQERHAEEAYINEHTIEHNIAPSAANGMLGKIAIPARVMLLNIGDLNFKEKSLMLYLVVGLHYFPKLFTHGEPGFEIVNAINKDVKLVKKHPNPDGSVDSLYLTKVFIEPNYLVPLYPTDTQLISLRLAAADMDSNYYIQVRDFQNYSAPTGDYSLTKIGFVNQIENYPVNLNQVNTNYYNQFSRIYLIYDHQNVMNYLKSIQYIILSLALTLFSLLLSSRKRGPFLERFGLISGAVFALASNVFQISSNVKPVNSFTVIDLIVAFTAIIIMLSFFTSLQSIRLADQEGYETSRAFDVAMFSVLFTYSVIFFIAIYSIL